MVSWSNKGKRNVAAASLSRIPKKDAIFSSEEGILWSSVRINLYHWPSHLMGVRPFDHDTFCNLPLYQLFAHQHMVDFLCPSDISFYWRAIFEFYDNFKYSKDGVGYLSFVHEHDVTIIDYEFNKFHGMEWHNFLLRNY